MRCIILAAGTGSRLGEITKVRTKGMVPVLGKRLIDYLLDFIETDFFDEIIVVGGFCYEDLKNHVSSKGIKNVRVIENSEYLKGNIYTMLTALKEFGDDSFLMTNVDHIYPRELFERMKPSFSGITAMCDFDRNLGADDMKVKLDSSRKIKSISKQLDDFDCGYIGMTYVDKTEISEYRSAARKAIEKFGEKAVVENVLQILSSDGYPVKISDLSGIGWFEVDTPEDLAIAEKGLPLSGKFRL